MMLIRVLGEEDAVRARATRDEWRERKSEGRGEESVSPHFVIEALERVFHALLLLQDDT